MFRFFRFWVDTIRFRLYRFLSIGFGFQMFGIDLGITEREIFRKKFFSLSEIDPSRDNFMRGICISHFRDLKIFPRMP
jgi:hypothetical protein